MLYYKHNFFLIVLWKTKPRSYYICTFLHFSVLLLCGCEFSIADFLNPTELDGSSLRPISTIIVSFYLNLKWTFDFVGWMEDPPSLEPEQGWYSPSLWNIYMSNPVAFSKNLNFENLEDNLQGRRPQWKITFNGWKSANLAS